MIKLVLSDMDGTLLHNDKTMPEGIEGLFETLFQKGVFCGAATGRSLASLKRDFPNFQKHGTFISDNGAIISHQGTIIFESVLPSEWIHEVIDLLANKEHKHLVLCGINEAYVLKKSKHHDQNFKQYYPNIIYCDDLHEVKHKIIKISILDEVDAKQYSYPLLQHLTDRMSVVVSAHEWVDVNLPGISKGMAVNKLQELLNITKDESMAFGDYYNDIEMLGQVTHSYAMANAVQDIKDICKYECSSNEDEGVIQVIKEKFQLEV